MASNTKKTVGISSYICLCNDMGVLKTAEKALLKYAQGKVLGLGTDLKPYNKIQPYFIKRNIMNELVK